jgi:glutamate/tyrosine decarboxylase-like PLP-dependent enzyme/anti-sigma regulatory factor (Ser/Thr protein kinase)
MSKMQGQSDQSDLSATLGLQDDGVAALLKRAPAGVRVDPKALFLGPKAENADLVEQMLLRVYRDYASWRRNFHPEDPAVIQPEDQRSPAYDEFVSRFERELFTLLGELKTGIPFYSPRYIGHMLADVSLPALVGYIATMLYNPNNVSWEASPVTTLLEIEVARDLAQMLGLADTPEQTGSIWGHITSGGTLANIEAIWVAKAVKFLPIAVRDAAADLGVTGLTVGGGQRDLHGMTAWELVNLRPSEALDLKEQMVLGYVKQHRELTEAEALAHANDRLKRYDILSLGDHAFFARLSHHDTLEPGIMFAPHTIHYSWVKGPGAIGIGAQQVVPIPVNADYRMDTGRLRQKLEWALQEKRPVIAVVGVVGTTEEGAVDPMDELIGLREESVQQNQSFSLHCDAAYGGYIAACFRSAGGELRELGDMQQEYAGWPSAQVYQSFSALKGVDSVTVDPHKLGFVPYPAGAIVFRDGRVKELVAQEAAYALGGRTIRQPGEIYIGKYILEGSKPGAAAAATFLSHRVVPLNENGYGAVLGLTMHSARAFHDRILESAEALRDEFVFQPLNLPDTNILNYAFNPVQNDRLDVMNRFNLALYRELHIDPTSPVQTRRFIVSHAELAHEIYGPAALRVFLQDRMGIRGDYLVSPVELTQRRAAGEEGYDDVVVSLRTTLMNPFILEPVRGDKDYIQLFLETLPPLLRKVRRTLEVSTPLRIQANLERLAEIRRFVRERATTLGVDPDILPDVLLAVDEAVTNIIVHGYRGREGSLEIEVGREGDALVVRVRDEASPFDPTAVPPPDVSLPAEERVSAGMGVHLIRQTVDEVTHRLTLQRGNELTLVKRGLGSRG